MTKTEKVYLVNWLQYRGILDNWKAAIKDETKDISRLHFDEGLISGAFTWADKQEGYEFWAIVSSQFNSDFRGNDDDWFASLPDKEQRKLFICKYPSQVNLRAKIPSQNKPNVARNNEPRLRMMRDAEDAAAVEMNVEEHPRVVFDMERYLRDAIGRIDGNGDDAVIRAEPQHVYPEVELPDVGF